MTETPEGIPILSHTSLRAFVHDMAQLYGEAQLKKMAEWEEIIRDENLTAMQYIHITAMSDDPQKSDLLKFEMMGLYMVLRNQGEANRLERKLTGSD